MTSILVLYGDPLALAIVLCASFLTMQSSRTSENKPEDGNAAADSMFKNFDKYRNKISKVLD